MLSTDHHGPSSTERFYPAYDGNGNAGQYLDAGGATAAYFHYDPFGQVIMDGDSTKRFPIRFSTKWQDFETGLNYYGYRYYDPTQGRWLNRDPLEEAGGINMYGFVRNHSLDSVDGLGLKNVNIEIHYDGFDEGEINQRVRSEFRKIFERCFAKCKKPCHSVTITWMKTETKGDDFDPDINHHHLTKTPNFWGVGQNNGYRSIINPEKATTDGNMQSVQDPDAALAVALAHEIGYHGIGDNAFHNAPDNQFVDSQHPPPSPNQEFSKKACESICDELGVD